MQLQAQSGSRGNWYKVSVTRSNEQITFTVNGNTVQGRTPGANTGLTVDGAYYLGDVPGNVVMPSEIESGSGFVGCIQDLRVKHLVFAK